MRNSRAAAAIVGLVAIAAVVAVYILDHQRLRFPIVEDGPYRLQAEVSDAAGVMPGQGQTVRVAGVRIGDIAKVELRRGRALVSLDIDQRYRNVIRTDARALLRPKTALKDMFLEVMPGTRGAPVAREGWTMPVGNTLPDIDPDEVFAGLDADTRAYLQLLLQGAGEGLDGRAAQLGDLMRRFEPLHRDLARVNSAVAGRRADLRRVVRTLRLLNEEVAGSDDALAELVDASARTFRGFATEQRNVSASIAELPSALRESTRALRDARALAGELRPAAEALRPPVRRLRAVNEQLTAFGREATPLFERDVRPFVREAAPLLERLRPAARRLDASAGGLRRSAAVLNHLFNMLAYNPRGKEGPDVAGRDEGILFLLAWGGHQAVSAFSQADAHGAIRSLTSGGTCYTLRSIARARPELEFVTDLTGVLTDPAVCGGAGS